MYSLFRRKQKMAMQRAVVYNKEKGEAFLVEDSRKEGVITFRTSGARRESF